jgi:hypothetical protein
MSHQVIANALSTMELDKRTVDDLSFASICSNVAYGMRATYHTGYCATRSAEFSLNCQP